MPTAPSIMKVLDALGATRYIFHPERVHEIRDAIVTKNDRKKEVGVQVWFSSESHVPIAFVGVNARQVKRDIQANLDVSIGFLKVDFETPGIEKARRYINVESILEVKPTGGAEKTTRAVIDRQETDQQRNFYVHIDAEPFDVAYQIRRVLQRLDQDQTLCCDKPEEETEEE